MPIFSISINFAFYNFHVNYNLIYFLSLLVIILPDIFQQLVRHVFIHQGEKQPYRNFLLSSHRERSRRG
jgi:hypothetical protein